ncbi:hypothetical protein FHW69_002788 [Luteibacter sp. Sphag1AF]|uniref:hypothetical protein n=1 Tax=Luteibacter sp. Sphag1AF TaxID=2587031 RepID=UPI00160963F4|nr:hypothetical protein [Luteibacter sp. Sphag1AF]MBB3228153.1 hypothetical protein [Luteibacter sp. Sphag1AF]
MSRDTFTSDIPLSRRMRLPRTGRNEQRLAFPEDPQYDMPRTISRKPAPGAIGSRFGGVQDKASTARAIRKSIP